MNFCVLVTNEVDLNRPNEESSLMRPLLYTCTLLHIVEIVTVGSVTPSEDFALFQSLTGLSFEILMNQQLAFFS